MEQQWSVYHSFRHLVDEGRVKPLVCPDCDTPVATRIRRYSELEDEPWLWCPTCDAWTRPGLDLYSRILAVVREHT
jgi:hypothetical protein